MLIDLFIYLLTNDSFPPFYCHKYKLVKKISEIQTKTEIDLYLLTRNKCFDYVSKLITILYHSK